MGLNDLALRPARGKLYVPKIWYGDDFGCGC